jgi:hypothetical protein
MITPYIYPVPEIIAPGRWKIRNLDRGGHSGRGLRIFAAPLRDTPYARAVRMHEMAHVRYSPVRPQPARHGVRPDTLLAAEDARVNELAWRAGLGDVIVELDDPAGHLPDPHRFLRAATLLLVALHRTRGFPRVGAYLADCGDPGQLACRLAARAVALFTAPPRSPGFRVTVDVARMLDRLLVPAGPADGFAAGSAGDADGCAVGRFLRRGRRSRVGGAGSQWGELRGIEEPPRPIALGRRLTAVTHRAVMEGVLLRAPHRLLTDGRVFAHRRHLPGGSVLVDASASMALAADDIAGIIAAAAGAQVACYDGTSEGWGMIRVLARGGRRVADTDVAPPVGHGGNVIDGPALRWLATQPAPRIWVSDGCVTGLGDRSGRALREDAAQVCERAGIVRVRTAEDARAILLRRPPGAAAPAAV